MMKRFAGFAASALVALTMCASPARAETLMNATITAAAAAVLSPVLQARDGNTPESVAIEMNLTYGSGGTSIDAWVQTSLDAGGSWIDIAQFSFTTASAKRVYNLSRLTPVTSAYTPTDGTLTANTAKDGILGPRYRVKYTSVGTYAGSTTLVISIAGVRLAP